MPRPVDPHMGEVWDVDFSPQVGREQSGIRPALVISNEQFNRLPNGLAIVVPFTGTDRGLHHHLPVAPPEGGLTKRSVIMCDQARAQSEDRFLRHRGHISPELLRQVQWMVGHFIDR